MKLSKAQLKALEILSLSLRGAINLFDLHYVGLRESTLRALERKGLAEYISRWQGNFFVITEAGRDHYQWSRKLPSQRAKRKRFSAFRTWREGRP